MKQLNENKLNLEKNFPPPSGSWSFHSECLLAFWSHVYFAEQTKSFTLSASPCPCQTSLKEPFQGYGSSPRPRLAWVTPWGTRVHSTRFSALIQGCSKSGESISLPIHRSEGYDNSNSHYFIECSLWTSSTTLRALYPLIHEFFMTIWYKELIFFWMYRWGAWDSESKQLEVTQTGRS